MHANTSQELQESSANLKVTPWYWESAAQVDKAYQEWPLTWPDTNFSKSNWPKVTTWGRGEKT
jgi:hypothetical protein